MVPWLGLCALALAAQPAASTEDAAARPIPVYLMMPLDAVSDQGLVKEPELLREHLAQVKTVDAAGVMLDMWWGLVERAPQVYDWTPYLEIARAVRREHLRMQVVMSFHRCGGNVGDNCNIPLPAWLGDAAEWGYIDRAGRVNPEYISLFHDAVPVGHSQRTPLQMYGDFMASFASTFREFLQTPGSAQPTIAAVEVGLGPCGELRYPSYELSRWVFPGIGEFQAYDRYALASLASTANATGRPEWGQPPDNAGNYSSMPGDAPFFAGGERDYASEYGQFFLSWYSGQLVEHGRRVLAQASAAFGAGTHLEGKVAGIHWHYEHPSHAAALTAGYYNLLGPNSTRDGYLPIAQMLKEVEGGLCFTCLEMRDWEQPDECGCSPETLVMQTKRAAWKAGVRYSGENALARYDNKAYGMIEHSAHAVMPLHAFTYLRLGPDLLQQPHFSEFSDFVERLGVVPNATRPTETGEPGARRRAAAVGSVFV